MRADYNKLFLLTLLDDITQTILQGLDNKNQEVVNFLELLAKNNRLLVLPFIFDLFDELVKQDKNMASAIIQSAFAMSEEEKNQFETILSKKFNKKINATIEINPELIGGIKVLVDNTVIDASIKGSLEKMAIQLTQ
jgi:F-type H+-transporting ATPase subunit delta